MVPFSFGVVGLCCAGDGRLCSSVSTYGRPKRDETPPVPVRMEPSSESVNLRPEQLTMEFDEYGAAQCEPTVGCFSAAGTEPGVECAGRRSTHIRSEAFG